jgi:hypothetical protein
MKKILIFTNIVLITIIVVMSCNPTPTPPKPEKIGGIFVKGQGLTPKGIIDDSLAIIMSQLYKEDLKKSRMSNDTSQYDTRSIWFSLATLESFINKIKSSVADKNFDMVLGTRIYFAKYPAQLNRKRYPELTDLRDDVTGRHTIFFVPTFYDTSMQEHVDFNYLNVGTDNAKYPKSFIESLRDPNYRPEFNGSILGHDKSVWVYTIDPQRQYSLVDGIQNHGGMAPPPAKEASFPSPDPAGGN